MLSKGKSWTSFHSLLLHSLSKLFPSSPREISYESTFFPPFTFLNSGPYSVEMQCRTLTFVPLCSFSFFVLLHAQLYHQSPVLMLQQLVDGWIMQETVGATVTPPVVRVADFPNPEYEEDGFWSGVRNAWAPPPYSEPRAARKRLYESGADGRHKAFLGTKCCRQPIAVFRVSKSTHPLKSAR